MLKADKLATQSNILTFIINNPGTHLRKIKNSLGYSMGTVQYHINNLEKENKIISKKTTFYKNYYYFDTCEHDNNLMNLINLDSARKIILHLLKNEPCNHREISNSVGLSSSTVTWHMKKFLNLGLVEVKYDGKFSIYSLTNKQNILQLLQRYKHSTWNNMMSNVTDIFTSFNTE